MVVKHAATEQMPRACVAHTLTAPDREQNVRFFRRRAHSQEIIGRCGCFTAAAKNLSCALALRWLSDVAAKYNEYT